MPGMRRLPHGYTNRTVGDGSVVVKEYAGPDSRDRQRREQIVLDRLAGTIPLPPLVTAGDLRFDDRLRPRNPWSGPPRAERAAGPGRRGARRLRAHSAGDTHGRPGASVHLPPTDLPPTDLPPTDLPPTVPDLPGGTVLGAATSGQQPAPRPCRPPPPHRHRRTRLGVRPCRLRDRGPGLVRVDRPDPPSRPDSAAGRVLRRVRRPAARLADPPGGDGRAMSRAGGFLHPMGTRR